MDHHQREVARVTLIDHPPTSTSDHQRPLLDSRFL